MAFQSPAATARPRVTAQCQVAAAVAPASSAAAPHGKRVVDGVLPVVAAEDPPPAAAAVTWARADPAASLSAGGVAAEVATVAADADLPAPPSQPTLPSEQRLAGSSSWLQGRAGLRSPFSIGALGVVDARPQQHNLQCLACFDVGA